MVNSTLPGKDPATDNYRRAIALATNQALQYNFAAAIDSYREAIKYRPESANAYYGLSSALRSQYTNTGRKFYLKEAVSAGKRAVELAPNDPWTHYYLANSLFYTDKKQALKHIEEALRLSPNSPKIHICLGDYYWVRRRKNKALQSYEKALSLNPNDGNALVRCAHYWIFARGNLTKAEELLTQALNLHPGYHTALIDMGLVRLRQGRIKEAMEHARVVIGQRPDDFGALTLVAMIEVKNNWFRGMDFRLTTWFSQYSSRWGLVLFFTAFATAVMGALAYLIKARYTATIWMLILPTLALIHLYSDLRYFRSYVRRKYQAPQKLDEKY
jgi:tetratricopeptide (TPR) repeat protein